MWDSKAFSQEIGTEEITLEIQVLVPADFFKLFHCLLWRYPGLNFLIFPADVRQKTNMPASHLFPMFRNFEITVLIIKKKTRKIKYFPRKTFRPKSQSAHPKFSRF